VPYLYTLARLASETGVSLCRPMYYEYPEAEAAYAARYQYFLGDQMIAAPIVHPADPETGLAATDVWVPEGTWIDRSTRETFAGPRWVRLVGDLSRVPVLVRAGTILPLAPPFEAQPPPRLASGTTGAIPGDRLVLSVFPGAEGAFRLYEDDGVTEAYREGQYEWTEVTTRMASPGTWEVHVAPVEGRCDVLPRQRGYEIRLEGSRRPQEVTVDGQRVSDWRYDAGTLTTVVLVPPRDKGSPVTVTAVARDGISALGEAHNRRSILSDVGRLLGGWLPDTEDDDVLLDAVLRLEAPGQADALARLGGPLVRFIEFVTPEEAAQQLGRVIVGAPARADEPYDLEVTFTLFRGGRAEPHSIRLEGRRASQIVDAPFAFDGRRQMMRWEAEVEIAWRGQTLRRSYRSLPLCPAIYGWQALVIDEDERPSS